MRKGRKSKKHYNKSKEKVTKGYSNVAKEKLVEKVTELPKLEEVEHKSKAKLIVTQEVEDTIDFLHSKVGNKEWSGFMVYTVDEGSVNDPSSMVTTIRGIYLLDVGSGAYTEFSAGNKIVDVYDEFEGLIDDPERWKLGKIHTHHHMGAYHSGTDMKDLHDHSHTHAYYMSLVVDFQKEYDCKIGLKCVEQPRRLLHKDGKGGEDIIEVNSNKSFLVVIDCDIVMPEKEELKVPSHIKSQLEEIEKESKSKSLSYHSLNKKYGSTCDQKEDDSTWDQEAYLEDYYAKLGRSFRQDVTVKEIEEEDHSKSSDEDYNGFSKTEIKDFLNMWLSNDYNVETLLISNLQEALKKTNDDNFLADLNINFEDYACIYFGEQEPGFSYSVQLAEGCLKFLESSVFDFLASEKMDAIKFIIQSQISKAHYEQ